MKLKLINNTIDLSIIIYDASTSLVIFAMLSNEKPICIALQD